MRDRLDGRRRAGKPPSRTRAEVRHVAEAIGREHPGISMEKKFKFANAAITRKKRRGGG